jgi:hypothetical protein
MTDKPKILICSCEDTMRLDADAVRACGDVTTARHLCRAELDKFRTPAGRGAALIVGCTQEAPLFAEVAAESDTPLTLVNIRETAGWSNEGAAEDGGADRGRGRARADFLVA